jgi:hypothetical protein
MTKEAAIAEFSKRGNTLVFGIIHNPFFELPKGKAKNRAL